MENNNDLGSLSIREILEKILGPDKANELLQQIQRGFDEGLRGEDLKKHIFDVLCQLSVDEIDIYYISNLMLKMVNP